MVTGEFWFDCKQVAILRALPGLGDFLCIVPALRSLRAALPQAKISLIGLPQTQALVQRFSHYLDELLIFPGYPGLPEQTPQVPEFPAFLAAVQQRQFDLAIQMQGSGVLTNPITALLGAKHNAGFFLADHYCPDPIRFLPYPSHESEVRRYLRLLTFLGIPAQGETLEFPLHAIDIQALEAIKAIHPLRRYICIHPGASVVSRRWSPQQFAIVADALTQRGFQVVLTGSASEQPLTQTVAKLMRTPALNLAGCTDLGALARLIQQSHLLICNDTGVAHLAVALQTPSVVIFKSSEVERWAPLDRLRHRVCHAAAITAQTVIDQAEALLQFPLINPELSALEGSGRQNVSSF
jgi:ADP-heptose:LPS heptosyltransferase